MKMLSKPRLDWARDGLNQTLAVVIVAASVALYFIVARGWSW